jgi:hypothetical protein
MEVLEQQREYIIDGGFMIDPETGEILGMLDTTDRFEVKAQDDAEWVLKKMLSAEADMAAIDNMPDVIRAKAVLENAEKLKKEQQCKLDWLHRRFDNELGEFARRQLEGQKGKTLKTIYGSISLRVKKGGLKVLDPAKALLMAKMDYPHAVKTTESFLISMLTDSEKETLVKGLTGTVWTDEDEARKAFTVEPDSETVTVKTGVA